MPMMTLKERLAQSQAERTTIQQSLDQDLALLEKQIQAGMPSGEVRMKLYDLVKKSTQSGLSPVKYMLRLMQEQHAENRYADSLGVKNSPGIDGVPPPPRRSNLTVFYSGHDCVFIGDDAIKASEVLLSYAEQLFTESQYSSLTGTQRQILQMVENGIIEVKEWDGHPCLRLTRTHWNDWLVAFYSSQVGLDGYEFDRRS